jgi:hypothetical protein
MMATLLHPAAVERGPPVSGRSLEGRVPEVVSKLAGILSCDSGNLKRIGESQIQHEQATLFVSAHANQISVIGARRILVVDGSDVMTGFAEYLDAWPPQVLVEPESQAGYSRGISTSRSRAAYAATITLASSTTTRYDLVHMPG